MKIILTAERGGLPAGRVEFEMSDEILQYERQRVFQMGETISNHVPKLVEGIIIDDDINKKIADFKTAMKNLDDNDPKKLKLKREVSDAVEKKIVNIFGKAPAGVNGDDNGSDKVTPETGEGSAEVSVKATAKEDDKGKGTEAISVKNIN